ncbi:MAG: hypothetical protein IT250_04725 [Chitinophagaceae bacterium]|nr:hypothetical protein [Chitinophagaceae bacterium]
MLFKDVIGQQHVKQQLLQLVQQNRLSHALLFLGKEGSGALSLAMAFANYVSLRAYPPQDSSADHSLSLFNEPPNAKADSEEILDCQEADAWMQKQQAWPKADGLIHPDIHFSYPVVPRKSGDKPISTDYVSEWRQFIKQQPYGDSFSWLQHIGAENKQGNITVYECNDIIRKLSLKSFESRYKILLMWLPEYLGVAGNKLLKLIEEPPPNTLFLLVAENESLILPTILSRTQLIKVPALELKEIEQALIQREHAESETASQIALMSEGSYREALQLLRDAEDNWLELLRSWLNAILKSGPVAQVKWIESMGQMGREKQKQFIRYFNHLLQQAIRIQVMPDQVTQLPEAEGDFALRLNKLVTFHQHQAIIEELDKAAYHIERNANAKVLFHALTIRLYHIIAKSEVVEMK